MLKNYTELANRTRERFSAISQWPEIHFDQSDKEQIKALNADITLVNSSSIQVRASEKNHCIVPSQYILYAICVKPLAIEIKKHFDLLDTYRQMSPSAETPQRIIDRDLDISNLGLDEFSKKLAFFLFSDGSLGAKSFINDSGQRKHIRPSIDCFTSVILKVINTPNASSAILGDILYWLTASPEIYSYLEHKFLSLIPGDIISETKITDFTREIFTFLYQYDNFNRISHLISKNSDSSYTSIKENELTLTSIFKTSKSLLSEAELSMSGLPRFHKEPLFILNDEFCYLSTQWTNDRDRRLDLQSLIQILQKHYPEFVCTISDEGYKFAPNRGQNLCPVIDSRQFSILPKPFLLLAGISGTGKTRFVRQQAEASAAQFALSSNHNYCLVPVRPDWHEPSDLLGYVSRISQDGHPRYIVPEFLKFIVSAWLHSVQNADENQFTLRDPDGIAPYWLCLDEMNLAPVEQYFADYLSILETRNWSDGQYSCDPLLKPGVLSRQLDETGLNDFWEKVDLDGPDALSSGLRAYFLKNGIPIPPNLIVAGTVNMDETTHGFSRKVIDRALTIDFNHFFPNDYSQYYEKDKKHINKTFFYPALSEIREKSELSNVPADPEGINTQEFLDSVNTVLKGTPFELAYRALNEALLFIHSFTPADATELQSAWDDFIMMKLLPRIEGDSDKLGYQDGSSLLNGLMVVLMEKLSVIWGKDSLRPDLFRETLDGKPVHIPCRSKQKLEWMQKRLERDTFTSYWP